MKSQPKSKGELFFSGLLFILGLLIMVSSMQIGFGRLTKPGPGLFPFICGLILCVQSVILTFFRQKNERERENVLSHPGAPAQFLWMLVSFILWILLMPVLGWLPLTFLITLAIAKIMRMKGWMKPLFLAGANTAFSYLLFGYLLAIDLPNGFWA
jgi:putative tricarboxylic transport membrane protein